MFMDWEKYTKICGYTCRVCGRFYKTKDDAIRCFDSHRRNQTESWIMEDDVEYKITLN